MEIIVAKTAGFCFGVNRAIKVVYELAKETRKKIYTIGPIIHNKQVVEQLRINGVEPIQRLDELENVEESEKSHCSGYVVIRTHGVAPDIYNEISKKNLEIIDATCPYVKKIQSLVKEKHDEGYRIIIVGDSAHPEVSGINGWCDNTACIVGSASEAEALPNSAEKTCVVAQTTVSRKKWEIITEILKRKFENLIEFDTICNETGNRQKEAAVIAKKVDIMIVIGGRDSSNTKRLYEECKANCYETYNIETIKDLPPLDKKNVKKIGITAGASTPDWIIKEVIEKMNELNKEENDMNFKEAFENSLVTLQAGEIVKGRIIGFSNTEVYVDLGYKSDGIIPMEEFTEDPDFKPEENLKVGDEIEAYIMKINDGEGNVQLSKKKVDFMRGWEALEESYEKKTPVKAKVFEETNGGLIASVNGVKVFIPASQVGEKFVKDLKEYLNKTIDIRIIEFNKSKKKVVGSQRVLLQEEKTRQENELWENIEVGKKYTGIVKSLTDFGAFVDIGGVDGLVHISEISWTKIKHPSEVLNIGDKIDVIVLEFDKEKKRISLGYKKQEDNPWNKIEEKYKVGDIIKGKVVRLVPFGAFIELENGVDGLVHISQISDFRIAKPSDVLKVGDYVEAKIIELDSEAKRISLSIKEVNPINPVIEQSNDKKEEGENEVTEHVEEITVTIGDMIGSTRPEQEENEGK